jgi:hypothetical protein
MTKNDRRRADIAAELAVLDRVASMGVAGLHDDLQAHLADWQGPSPRRVIW